MKPSIKDLKHYWRTGTWVSKRLPMLFACYAMLYLPFLLADGFLNFIPKPILHINMAFLLFTSFYSGCCMLDSRRNLKIARRELIEMLAIKVIGLAAVLDFETRPTMTDLSGVAAIVTFCKKYNVDGCDAEIALLESWVRFWDEEKVVTIK